MRTFLKPLSFIPALLLMYMIYSFSAQDGETSAALSYKVSYYMVKTADRVLDAGLEDWEIQNLANRFQGVTRKLAHMTEYFALAIAVSFPLYVYGMHGILLLFTAGVVCVAFACGDEYHQSFVAGRAPSARDVLIDSFGVFWGIIVVRIIGWTGRKTIFRPRRSKKKKGALREPEYTPEYEPEYEPGYFSRQETPPSVYPPPSRSAHTSRADTPYGRVRSPQGQERYRDYVEYPRSYPHYTPQEIEETHVSDKLSEDMSFRKLVHDLRGQHRQGKNS